MLVIMRKAGLAHCLMQSRDPELQSFANANIIL